MDSERLPITGPCPIDLDEIGFDRRAKQAFCGHCRKNVVNLSNMTRGEAGAFLREHAGETMCVSYARQADGQIRFQAEAPSIVPLARVRLRPSRAVPATAAAGLALALAACTPHGKPQERQVDGVEDPDVRTPTRHIPIEPDPIPVAAGMMPIPEHVDPVPVEPDPIPLVGEAPLPERLVEGRVAVPEEIMDGEISVPEIAEPEAEPCDPPTPDTHSMRRGKIALPTRPID